MHARCMPAAAPWGALLLSQHEYILFFISSSMPPRDMPPNQLHLLQPGALMIWGCHITFLLECSSMTCMSITTTSSDLSPSIVFCLGSGLAAPR